MDTRSLAKLEFENACCPICGNTKLKPLLVAGSPEVPCYLSICRRDGMVLLNPRWTEAGYRYFYEQCYDSLYRSVILRKETNDQKYEKARIMGPRIDDMLAFKKARSVLDIGAGMGWTLQWLQQEHGFEELYAIEPSLHCAENVRSNVSAELVARDITEKWEVKACDFIVMRHVLEHLVDPYEALRKVEASLAPGGIAYIAVPNMMSPTVGLYEGWFRVVHLYYFCIETLNYLALTAGLEPVRSGVENGEIWVVYQKTKTVRTGVLPQVYRRQLWVIRKCLFRDSLAKKPYGRCILKVRKSVIRRFGFRK